VDNLVVTSVQSRLLVAESVDEVRAHCRRYLRQAQARSAQLVVFPELTGLIFVAPLVPRLRLGLIRQSDRGRRSGTGLIARAVGRVAEAAATALGGSWPSSLRRLLDDGSTDLEELYRDTFSGLAREFRVMILAGSLYVRDRHSGSVHNRAFLFDSDGAVIGHQDKLNLSSAERTIATPGASLGVRHSRVGRLGILVGHDILCPEISRWFALQGADLLAGIAASPSEPHARLLRSAMALRTEENQVYSVASFLLGPNMVTPQEGREYVGQSAVLAPIDATVKGDGVLIQTGSLRTEGVVTTTLDAMHMQAVRVSARFAPRAELHLGGAGPGLADFYRDGLTIEQAIVHNLAGHPAPAEPIPPQPQPANHDAVPETAPTDHNAMPKAPPAEETGVTPSLPPPRTDLISSARAEE